MEYELRIEEGDAEPAFRSSDPSALHAYAEYALMPVSQGVVVELRMAGRRIAMVRTMVAELAIWAHRGGALPRPCLE